MRIIPVMDLMNGQAVHAVKGNRSQYKPVKSVLCNSADPLCVARAFQNTLGTREMYIADLNAIQDARQTCNREIITSLAQNESIDVILDSGVSDVAGINFWLACGIHKVIMASETVGSWASVMEIPKRLDPARLIFSLDSRDGKILSQCSTLEAMPPMDIFQHIQTAGWREVILLDLHRVGSSSGVDRSLIAQAHAAFPDLELLVGGGVASPDELLELERMDVQGILIATALHRGIIQPHHLRRYSS